MTDEDSSKVPVHKVLSKFSRYEYSLEDAAELIAKVENTDDYGYMKRVVKEILKQAIELTGELSKRIVNGEYSIRHDELKAFSKKQGWRFGDDENEQPPKPQQQNEFSDYQITCLCMLSVESLELFSDVAPNLPQQKYKNIHSKLRAGKISTTKWLEILKDRTKDSSYKIQDNSTFKDVMTLARDRIKSVSENSETK